MAVLVGAIPGALPPWIGYAVVVPRVDELGFILFLVQFFWQFPHFWAIAWILHEDYQKAGYWLLPTKGGRDKRSAYQVLIYTVILNLVIMMPLMYGIADIKAMFCHQICSMLQKNCTGCTFPLLVRGWKVASNIP